MNWYTKTKKDDAQGLIIDEQTGRNVAVSYDPKDARLIAAAPELLDALQDIVIVLRDNRTWDANKLSEWVTNHARAAIQKAEAE